MPGSDHPRSTVAVWWTPSAEWNAESVRTPPAPRERLAAVRGYFDHEPGVLAFAVEVWRLDGRTGRPVLAEPLGPDLVEHGPVTLKIPHDDADPHHVGFSLPAFVSSG